MFHVKRQTGGARAYAVERSRLRRPGFAQRFAGSARTAYARDVVAPRLGPTPSPFAAFVLASGVETLITEQAVVATCFTWNMSGRTWLLISFTTASKLTVDAELLIRCRAGRSPRQRRTAALSARRRARRRRGQSAPETLGRSSAP